MSSVRRAHCARRSRLHAHCARPRGPRLTAPSSIVIRPAPARSEKQKAEQKALKEAAAKLKGGKKVSAIARTRRPLGGPSRPDTSRASATLARRERTLTGIQTHFSSPPQ
jgi:hypothetical protein